MNNKKWKDVDQKSDCGKYASWRKIPNGIIRYRNQYCTENKMELMASNNIGTWKTKADNVKAKLADVEDAVLLRPSPPVLVPSTQNDE